MSLGDLAALAPLCSRMYSVHSLVGSHAKPVAIVEVAHRSTAPGQTPARATDSHPYKVALDSCCGSSEGCNDRNLGPLGKMSALMRGLEDLACSLEPMQRKMCWSRRTD